MLTYVMEPDAMEESMSPRLPLTPPDPINLRRLAKRWYGRSLDIKRQLKNASTAAIW
jgi:hypothetical protein